MLKYYVLLTTIFPFMFLYLFLVKLLFSVGLLLTKGNAITGFIDGFSLSFVDAGGPAEQGEDTGQQPNPGRAKPHPPAPARTEEGAAHQALQLSSREL